MSLSNTLTGLSVSSFSVPELPRETRARDWSPDGTEGDPDVLDRAGVGVYVLLPTQDRDGTGHAWSKGSETSTDALKKDPTTEVGVPTLGVFTGTLTDLVGRVKCLPVSLRVPPPDDPSPPTRRPRARVSRRRSVMLG